MTVILGIDPGSRITGYGLIRVAGHRVDYVDSGCIRLVSGEERPLCERLALLFNGIQTLIDSHHPDEIAIEEVFLSNNASSALKLGQARGAAMVAASVLGYAVAEYSARRIKQSVVGTGAATKTQVQHMVTKLLNLPRPPQADAADALAVALCHSHARKGMAAMGATGIRRGRAR
jgi:crossover junction endodeoxyribonuclease RuvC